MVSDITLTASERTQLLSLQENSRLSQRTQVRLTTGRSVNSVEDEAVKYFRSKILTDRASDYTYYKESIDQGISALNTYIDALESVSEVIQQIKGTAIASASWSENQRVSATQTTLEIGRQIESLVDDAEYQGFNLLNTTATPLNIRLGKLESSEIEIFGFDVAATNINTGIFSNAVFTASGAFVFSNVTTAEPFAGFSVTGENNVNYSRLEAFIDSLDTALDRIQDYEQQLGLQVAFLQTRLEFNEVYVKDLVVGSDKLVLADLNEEGANIVALRTQQQLAIESLSIAGQSAQSILELLR